MNLLWRPKLSSKHQKRKLQENFLVWLLLFPIKHEICSTLFSSLQPFSLAHPLKRNLKLHEKWLDYCAMCQLCLCAWIFTDFEAKDFYNVFSGRLERFEPEITEISSTLFDTRCLHFCWMLQKTPCSLHSWCHAGRGRKVVAPSSNSTN